MIRKRAYTKGTLRINQSKPGETIETKIRRILNDKEPITDGAPRIYTERKDGVEEQYNIRTDRFELAVGAMDKITMDKRAKRDGRIKAKTLGEEAKEGMKKENDAAKGDNSESPKP